MASTLQFRKFAQKCKFPTSGKLEYLTMANLLPTNNRWLSWVTGSSGPCSRVPSSPPLPPPCTLACRRVHALLFFLYWVWSRKFASLTATALPRETPPGTCFAVLSVRPSLPSACVTPGPYVPLIFTVFYC